MAHRDATVAQVTREARFAPDERQGRVGMPRPSVAIATAASGDRRAAGDPLIAAGCQSGAGSAVMRSIASAA